LGTVESLAINISRLTALLAAVARL
jgi:hypothetical protein